MATSRKREQVKVAAVAVFLSQGFSGASVDEIALRADVSKATMYKFFPTKEVLFLETVREAFAGYAAAMEIPELGERSAEDVLTTLAQTIVGIFCVPELVDLFRLCVAEAKRFPEVARGFFEAGPETAVRHVSHVMEKLVAAGQMDIEDCDMAAWHFSELCKAEIFHQAVFGLRRTFSDREITAHAQAAVEMFLRAYGVRNPR